MLSSKELWNIPSSIGNGARSMSGSTSYSFLPSALIQGGGGPAAGSGAIPLSTPAHDYSQEVCKYFVNGGCLRGATCPYSHELPDERHLDVNGVGFILNPNVHNAQKTVPSQSGIGTNSGTQVSPTSGSSLMGLGLNSQQSPNRPFQYKGTTGKSHFNALSPSSVFAVPLNNTKPPSRYRPPEPYLEFNLPPVLALLLQSNTKDLEVNLKRLLLQN
ncbi:unnamed protein product [Phytomonas sp. EM1]|nr:unnamed protein product [Phytomonas sp. EM1]|eukprot:CCW61032.1 unnamed protein product [Phytomonas sp. isolate EM1]